MKKKYYNVEVIWNPGRSWSIYAKDISNVKAARHWVGLLSKPGCGVKSARIVRITETLTKVEEVIS